MSVNISTTLEGFLIQLLGFVSSLVILNELIKLLFGKTV